MVVGVGGGWGVPNEAGAKGSMLWPGQEQLVTNEVKVHL